MELIIKIAAGIMLGSVVLPLLICAVIWLLYLLYVGVYHFIMQIDRLETSLCRSTDWKACGKQ